MLFVNFFLLFMIMKFARSTICRNENDIETVSFRESDYYCQSLSHSNRSLVLFQSVTKDIANQSQEKDFIIQKRILLVPSQFRILFSVKVVMDSKGWNSFSAEKRRVIWSKARSQLYWSCENTLNSFSLCNKPGIETITSLTINISDAAKPIDYLQCIICFLSDSNSEYVTQWMNLSPYIDRVVLDLHRYLPQHLSDDHSAVQFQITRIDRIPVDNEIGRIFITNISLIDEFDIDNSIPNKKCQFFCGWGPECLLEIRDICNTKIDCISGEDEDNRLCRAIKNGVISLNYDLHSTISSNLNKNYHDGHVISTLKRYLFVIICVMILLALFIFVCWFMCRNCEVDSRFGDSARKLNSTFTTPDSDTSCSTCEMKSKLHSLDYASSNSRRQVKSLLSTQQSQFSDKTAMRDLQILKINRKETPFTAISSNSSNFTDRESLKQLCHNTPYYSPKDRAIQSSEWLNLFFHVSSEARHKSLLKQPPPNVNNGSSKIIDNKNPKFSATPLTCVFLVMI